MRSVSLVISLFVGLFFSAPLAFAAGHHGNVEAHSNSDAGAGSHGQHKPTAAQHAPQGHWSAPAAEKARANPLPMSRDGLMEASELYRENCAACHGAEGRGDGPLARELEREPANLFAMAQHHSDGDLQWKVAKGRGEMPGWEEVLSDAQIWMFVHYMKTLPAFFLAKRPEG